MSQALALAHLRLSSVLSGDVPDQHLLPLKQARVFVDEAIKRTRTLTFELSPPPLYEIGLEAALEWLAERMRERFGLRVECNFPETPSDLPESLRVSLFISTRALLYNVVKHAEAKQATVSMQRLPQEVVVKVADDGIGFDPAVVEEVSRRAEGFGLFSIRERMRNLGGSMTIDSHPGQGTVVTLTVPVNG